MKESSDAQLLQVYLKEYESLVQETQHRIGVRDNLVYAVLIAITGVISIAIDNVDRVPVLLVLPIVTFALGWTHLANDEKITVIGLYIRTSLTKRIRELTHTKDVDVLGWQAFHRKEKGRLARKIIQFLVNELLFVISGFIALFIFWISAPAVFLSLWWVAGIDALLLLILGIQLVRYADFK